MKRALVAIALLAALVGAVYLYFFHETEVEATVVLPPVTATIGSGEDAVAVGPRGQLLPWRPVPEEMQLPRLPLDEPPESGRLAGPVLAQARVLGAAPAVLRPYIESSYYGESGVDVVLDTGIELHFGDAGRVEEKWKAAVAVLASPETTTLDYVNLHAPRRPVVGGSGHALPTLP